MKQGHKVYQGFPDPARIRGSDEEIAQAFRDVRNRMRVQVLDYVRAWEAGA